MTKADANMWWIIIGAVIALVVLIVMMVIFTGKTQPLQQGLSNCEGKGGACAVTGEACPQYTLKSTAFDCPTGRVCCVGSPKSCTRDSQLSVCGEGKTCTDYGGTSYCT